MRRLASESERATEHTERQREQTDSQRQAQGSRMPHNTRWRLATCAVRCTDLVCRRGNVQFLAQHLLRQHLLHFLAADVGGHVGALQWIKQHKKTDRNSQMRTAQRHSNSRYRGADACSGAEGSSLGCRLEERFVRQAADTSLFGRAGEEGGWRRRGQNGRRNETTHACMR